MSCTNMLPILKSYISSREFHQAVMQSGSSYWDTEAETWAHAETNPRSMERLRRLYTLSLSKLRDHDQKYGDLNYKPAPFQLRWIRGYNNKAGLINMNYKGSTVLFYAASNIGVLYNWSLNQMKLLQGHRHGIISVASDNEGKWLVTADSGPENCVIIWDRLELYPQRTIFNPHGAVRTARVAISDDAKYILTLGYTDNVATLHWWIWSMGNNTPHAILKTEIQKSNVTQMQFNPYNSSQFILMTISELWIGASGKIVVMERGVMKVTEDYELKLRRTDLDMSVEHGRMVCVTFVQQSSQVLVGTARGYVMVFGYSLEYNENVDATNHENLKFIKYIKVSKNRINVIKSVDGMVVTGSNKGEIHIYDNQLKLMYWIHGLKIETVKGLSFNKSPRSYDILDPKCKTKCLCWERVKTTIDPVTGMVTQKLLKHKLPMDASREGKPLVLRDFIISTGAHGIWFCDFITEKLQPVLDSLAATVYTMSVHPEKSLMAIGNANGVVDLWNCVDHALVKRIHLRQFFKVVTLPDNDSAHCNVEEIIPEISVTCLKYSPSGLHLACGLNTGELIFLDPTTLDVMNKKTLKDTNFPLTIMEYCKDSVRLAIGDVGKTVCVYKYSCETKSWHFIAKHRAHYKTISSLMFLPLKNEDGEYKLISIGADRMLAEYDIGASSDERLEIKSLDRVEQSAQPLAAIYWPNPRDLNPDIHHTDLPLILTANSEFKYKIINHSTAMTMATVLGPRFNHPVNRLELVTLKEGEEERQYLIFTTKIIIGIQKLPLDGNPWKYTALIAHPEQITDIVFRKDIGMVYTSGIKDNCICQWEADYAAVDSIEMQGGDELDPYYCLIEDGRPGWLFQEIRDLFYYIQILCQGTFSPAMRRVKDFIPIDSLPDMMRALGHYPSGFEVENMLIEAKYQVYRKEPLTEVNFVDFVKLYINHRLAFGMDHPEINKAFKHFSKMHREEHVMTRERLLNVLRDYGEIFSPELSWYLLSILFGQSFEDRANMEKEDFSFLPEMISYEFFIHEIIGAPQPEQSSKDSAGGDGYSQDDSDTD